MIWYFLHENSEIMIYFIVEKPAPILNDSNFQKVFGKTLPLDEQNILREMEMVALPGMEWKVIQTKGEFILEVSSDDYPSKGPIYVDRRFGVIQDTKSFSKKKQLPSADIILERMKNALGLPYVWGGNFSAGIPEWKIFYPPPPNLSPIEEAYWSFRGVDCSGLLYEATEGTVPRNTGELIEIGKEVSIDSLRPLDLIFSPGHVCIVLNEDEIIESKLEFGGVVVTPLQKRLKSLDKYVVKRFHPH